MKYLYLFLFLFVNHANADDCCFVQKSIINQTIVNKTDIINNLIMPNEIEPLRIIAPLKGPAPLTMRPFTFQNNTKPNLAPQLAPQSTKPQGVFVELNITHTNQNFMHSPFIYNNVLINKTTSSQNTTTFESIKIDAQSGKITRE